MMFFNFLYLLWRKVVKCAVLLSIPALRPSRAFLNSSSRRRCAVASNTNLRKRESKENLTILTQEEEGVQEEKEAYERKVSPRTQMRRISAFLKPSAWEGAAIGGTLEGVVTESLACVLHEQLPPDIGLEMQHSVVKFMFVEMISNIVASSSSGSSSGRETLWIPPGSSEPSRKPLILFFVVRCLSHGLPLSLIHVSAEELRQLFF